MLRSTARAKLANGVDGSNNDAESVTHVLRTYHEESMEQLSAENHMIVLERDALKLRCDGLLTGHE